MSGKVPACRLFDQNMTRKRATKRRRDSRSPPRRERLLRPCHRKASGLWAHFLMGLPGSGKSSVKRSCRFPGEERETPSRGTPSGSGWVRGLHDIDPDQIKKRHPDWRADLPQTDIKLDKTVHKWSVRRAVDEFSCITRAARRSFVLDSSGSDYEWLISRMRAAERAGYALSLTYVRVPVEVCVLRNRRRLAASSHGRDGKTGAHCVPEDVIWRKARHMDRSFRKARRYATTVKVVENHTESELADAVRKLKAKPRQFHALAAKSNGRSSSSPASRPFHLRCSSLSSDSAHGEHERTAVVRHQVLHHEAQ